MQVSFFRAALPLLVACVMSATAATAAASSPCGSIVYTQVLRDADGTVRGSGLSLTLPASGPAAH